MRRSTTRHRVVPAAAWLSMLLAAPPVAAQDGLEEDQQQSAPEDSAAAVDPPDEELTTSEGLTIPTAPPPADPDAQKPSSGRRRPALAVFGSALALGTACGACGLAAAVAPLPLGFLWCGLTQGAWLLTTLYALFFVAAPVQLVGSFALALAMPFATTLGAAAMGYHRISRFGLVKVWLLSATAAVMALVLGVVGAGAILGIGTTIGYLAAFSGGVGHPALIYTLWLVFMGAFGVGALLPVTLAIVAQLIPALVVQAFPEGDKSQ